MLSKRGPEAAVCSPGDVQHESEFAHAGFERALPVAGDVLRMGKTCREQESQEDHEPRHAKSLLRTESPVRE